MPGVFLVINVVIAISFFPLNDKITNAFIDAVKGNIVACLIVTAVFSYLTGVLLRLARTDRLDRLSAGWLRKFRSKAKKDRAKKDSKSELYLTEEFPYIRWMGVVCERYLSKVAEEFYENTWKPRIKEKANKQFFNFCKGMITSEDERSANEIYAAESLSRYVVGMFYGLAISIVLIFIVVSWRLIKCEHSHLAALIVLAVIYLTALIWLIKNFRLVRIKEVETVFAASFKLRDKLDFEDQLPGKSKKRRKKQEGET